MKQQYYFLSNKSHDLFAEKKNVQFLSDIKYFFKEILSNKVTKI